MALGEAPGRGQRVGQRLFLVVELPDPVPHPARLHEEHQRVVGQEVGEEPLVLRQPRQPGLHPVEQEALGQPLPLGPAPGLGADELLGPGPHGLGREQLSTGKDLGAGDVTRGPLVGDREALQPVDLVAPQVDADGMVGGRRIHVEDRAPHGELAPRFDLVLPPVAGGDEPGGQFVAVDDLARGDRDGDDVLHVGPEPLGQRPHRGDDDGREDRRVLDAAPEPPQHPQPPAHGLRGRRHPLEGEGLPGREQLDRIGGAARPAGLGEELAQVVGQPLRLGGGRHPDHQRPAAGEPGQAGQEERPRRLRHRDQARRTPGQGGQRRVVSEQGREFAESHGVRGSIRRSSRTGGVQNERRSRTSSLGGG